MTLLKFLQNGGRMEFSSGYILKGDPKNNYIDLGYDYGTGFQSDGVVILDKDGLKQALKYAKEFEKDQKQE